MRKLQTIFNLLFLAGVIVCFPMYVSVADRVQEGVHRIWGETRYETSYEVADVMKEQMGIDKFDSIILVNGKNYPDALTGSYLATVKKAPIIMVNILKILILL